MRFHTLMLAAGFAACLAAPVQAQDGLQPVDGDPIEDLEGWLDETPAPESAGDGADPLAPTPAPRKAAPAAREPAEPELSPEERARRQRQINRNYDEAYDIYDGILNSDPIARRDRRIQNNEKIVAEYRSRIQQASKERRELQVGLYNRSFYLKQELERGKITRDAYARMIGDEERKYEQRSKVLKEHIDAWREELRVAQQRLDELKSERQMLLAQRPRPLRRGKAAAQKRQARPGERLLSTLRQRLDRVGRYDVRHTMDFVHPRDVLGGMGPRGGFDGVSERAEPFEDEYADDANTGGGPDW